MVQAVQEEVLGLQQGQEEEVVPQQMAQEIEGRRQCLGLGEPRPISPV